ISKLKTLERLTLYGAKITDNGLKHLEKLNSLKEMDLQGCKVTEEGLQQLKKKLPALRWHL
ncbi:MAG: leucine-rich repeat domain-containing protein, partial [Planctomycetota bacterium]